MQHVVTQFKSLLNICHLIWLLFSPRMGWHETLKQFWVCPCPWTWTRGPRKKSCKGRLPPLTECPGPDAWRSQRSSPWAPPEREGGRVISVSFPGVRCTQSCERALVSAVRRDSFPHVCLVIPGPFVVDIYQVCVTHFRSLPQTYPGVGQEMEAPWPSHAARSLLGHWPKSLRSLLSMSKRYANHKKFYFFPQPHHSAFSGSVLGQFTPRKSS